MAENMTNWQQLAAVYKKARDNSKEYRRDTLVMALTTKLAQAVVEGEIARIAVEGDVRQEDNTAELQFKILTDDVTRYFMVFPDRETAMEMCVNFAEMPTGDLLSIIANAEGIDGFQFVLNADIKTHKFSMGEITKKIAAVALDLGRKTVADLNELKKMAESEENKGNTAQ